MGTKLSVIITAGDRCILYQQCVHNCPQRLIPYILSLGLLIGHFYTFVNSELFPLRFWSNWWSIKAVFELSNSPFEHGALHWSTSGLPSNTISSACYLAFRGLQT